MKHIKNIEWQGGYNGYLRIIDQTRLPGELKYIKLCNPRQVYQAIKTLQTRGAPAIGLTAAYGVFLGIRHLRVKSFNEFARVLEKICAYLVSVRPTAVNLRWALERMTVRAHQNPNLAIGTIKTLLLREAEQILKEDKIICEQLGRHGARLIRNGAGILTHCNAGLLATGGIGTALAALYRAQADGKKFRVYSTETRPLLQGARLTTWELQQAGIDVTLICDNMAGKLMAEGKIDLVIVGADRIALNGDTANKIGTYQLAVLARHHRIPFYVAAPASTFDLRLPNGRDIPIEERAPEEIKYFNKRLISPKSAKIYNPAFDVTPGRYISALITEKSIIRSPYRLKINSLFAGQR